MNLVFKRSIEDKIVIKGKLSEDCSIVHIKEKDCEKDIVLMDYIKKFSGIYTEITIKTKSEEDLLDSDEE